MPDKTVETLSKAAVRAFTPLPTQRRNILTRDNGKEFAVHTSLS
jgi:IS30 family transposase